ncbi:macrophage mannose receptor 1-like [Astatotilapia calliptera]|uniref:macrophage mannose receptor 1-like n=1 Tax=Astatotilapia calliptera TaxID=8154 RepID=UPI000E408961|nr:macrophage mannose receptor 1-like [Astatotilapia calliptera]
MRITCKIFVILIQTFYCLASDDSPFQLTNRGTGFCLIKTNNHCNDIRWTTGDRLLVLQRNKCLGVQGKSVGSEVNLYDCDEASELQKWECKNETVLALKGQELYIELTADNTAILSRTTGPNNHLTISGTSSGACTRTYRELFTIGGNAAGRPCMFPFLYKTQWYSDCTKFDSSEKRLWCAVETNYQSERWGYCPTMSKEDWNMHPTTGAYYQLNIQSALTWHQAQVSCKQQGASLLSIDDPHEQAYITALLWKGGNTLWIGLILDPEHGWKWINGRPYRYMKWDSGHPLPNPGYNCAVVDPSVRYLWQSLPCSNKLGYICYSKEAEEAPTRAGTGFCSNPWIHYNGHCFHRNQAQKTWSEAQVACHQDGGDLVSIHSVEDQSFIISQLGYTSTDQLWIGMNDRKTEGLFDWSDHSTVTFTSWEFGKPAVSSEIKDCVLMRGENGNWADLVCEEQHGFICKKMSALRPSGEEVEQNTGCKNGWRRHGSYCYFIGIQTKTFDEAKNDCKGSLSYLADVSNGVDNAFLVSLVGMRPEKHFWLGLSNQKNTEEFVWTNTDSVRFTHWNAEMPGNRQGCVAMKTGIFAGLWDVVPCTNKEKYICKHLAEGAVLTPPPPTLFPPECASGWTRLGFSNRCFKLFDRYSIQKKTWFEAKDYCRAIGGDLLSIHSSVELQSVPRLQAAWIGLSAPDPDTGYVWSDGTPLNFQQWKIGEPNNKNNVESCVEMKPERIFRRQSWSDIHCEKYSEWLCQIRAGMTPNPPPDPITPSYNKTSDGWFEWNRNQYYINRNQMGMEDARRYCQQRHSDLVTISSEAERVFLWKLIQDTGHHPYWIGLIVDLDGTFAWMDDSPVVFQAWSENQPNFQNNDENCVAITPSRGFWHDYNCGFQLSFICKRNSSMPEHISVVPTVLPKGGCPQDWKKFNSKCYSIISRELETWEGARTQCKNKGGNLASILSKHVQVFLTSKMLDAPTTDLWIGLHYLLGYSFYWTNGQPVRYTNWRSLQMTGHWMFFTDDEDERDHRGYFSRDAKRGCAVMTTDRTTGIGKWDQRSCSDKNGYICLRNLDPSLPDSPEPTANNGYVKILNDSIKVVTQKMNWDSAKKYCELDGANLASLRNEWSQVYVELMALEMEGPLWIGLNKKQTGYFRPIDGWEMTFSNWDRFEPEMQQSCVYVNNENGKWKTADCAHNMASVCMKSTDVPPTESTESVSFPGNCPEDPASRTGYTWIPFKGYCYLFVKGSFDWGDASALCIRYGGTLTSIENPAEQRFIFNNVLVFKDSQPLFWIGMYQTHKGLWKWLDKTAIDFINWGPNEPGGFGTYGAIASLDGSWTTGRVYSSKGFICKAPKVLQAPTTIASSSIEDPKANGHMVLEVLLGITVTAIGIVIIIFLLKKSGICQSISENLTTFDNPMFFNNEQVQAGVVGEN